MAAWRDDADVEAEEVLRSMASYRINPSLLEICTETTNTGRMEGGYGSVFKAKLHSLEISQLEDHVRGFVEIDEIGDRYFVVPSEDGLRPQARHVVVGSTGVAVKKLRLLENKDRAQLKRRFVREIHIWSRSNHPNVVQFIGYHLALDQDAAWLVSRWNDGGNLQDLLDSVTLNENLIATILEDTAAGLADLHGREPPIVHGDIKPSNVLLTCSRRAQLCDFGLSQICLSDDTPLLKTSSGFRGTERWCSPEVLKGNPPTRPGDVWAWGVLAYQVAVGSLPFEEESNPVFIARVVNGELPQALPVLRVAFPLLGNMIERCWSLEPTPRPPIAACLLELQQNYAHKWSERAVRLTRRLHILLCFYFSLLGLLAWEVSLLTLHACGHNERKGKLVMAIIPIAGWILVQVPYPSFTRRWTTSWLSTLAMGMVKGEVRCYGELFGFMLKYGFMPFWLGACTWLWLRAVYCRS